MSQVDVVFNILGLSVVDIYWCFVFLRVWDHVLQVMRGSLRRQLNGICLASLPAYSRLSDGRWSTGGQRKRYKDSLKSSPKAFEINNESWESLAAERGTWRSLIRKEAESYEQTRIRQVEEKTLLRKFSATETGYAIITAIWYMVFYKHGGGTAMFRLI